MSVQGLPIATAADIPLGLVTVVDLPEDAQWERFVTDAPCGDVPQTIARAQTKKALGPDLGRVIERGCVKITVGSQIIVKRLGPPGGERSDMGGARASVFPAVHPQVPKRLSEGSSSR